ncbi:MAG: SulP family inorganic anion transporter [Desulfovibrionaceae bacterium]
MIKLSTAKLFPFMDVLRQYSVPQLRGDLSAALTVAAVGLPQSMAYAIIAGVHPKYGLYASILPVLVAALWGSSRYLVAGPTNAISMVLFSTLAHVSVGGVLISSMPEEVRMGYIFGLAVLTGVLQIVMGFARLGELVNFISHAVMVGFTAGAALLIGSGQIKNILGISYSTGSSFFPQIWDGLCHISGAHGWSVGVGCATMVCVLVLRHFWPRWPVTFISISLAALGSWFFDVQAYGVHLVGAMPQELPPLSLPPRVDVQVIRDLFFPAIAIALLGAVESLAIGKSMASARGQQVDGNQELIAQGLGNVAAGLTSGIPGCGSFARTAVNSKSGAKTRFSAAFSALYTLAFMLLLAPAVSYIPMPALAGILFVIIWGMIDTEGLKLCWKATRIDRSVLLFTFGATLVLNLEQAILLGVILSLVLFLFKLSHPRVSLLLPSDPLLQPYPWACQCQTLSVYMVEGTLFFGAISELENRLRMQDSKGCRVVVLHLARVFWVDASGVHALEQFVERCHARSIPLVLVVGNDNVEAILHRTGLLSYLGEGFMVRTLHEGLHSARALLRRGHCPVCGPDCAIGRDGGKE